jgi:hypothetical protein
MWWAYRPLFTVWIWTWSVNGTRRFFCWLWRSWTILCTFC